MPCRSVALLALCVAPVFTGACASTRVDDAATPADVAAVVFAAEIADRAALLRARAFPTVDLTDAYLLLTSDNLAGMLDLAAPEHWPAPAQEAWTSGAAACRARAVRPPWQENDEARRCAAELGPAVLHRLARAHGARILMIASPDRVEKWRVVAQTPGDDDARRVAGADLAQLLDEAWARGGYGMTMQRPSLPQPTHPDDDLTRAGYYQPFDVIAVAGCIRPMPIAIDVAPADVPLTNMIEHAWSTLSATVRTGPATTCRLHAVRAGQIAARIVEGTLDCEGMPLIKKGRKASPTVTEDDVANLAKDLVNQLAFDTCKMRPL